MPYICSCAQGIVHTHTLKCMLHGLKCGVSLCYGCSKPQHFNTCAMRLPNYLRHHACRKAHLLQCTGLNAQAYAESLAAFITHMACVQAVKLAMTGKVPGQ